MPTANELYEEARCLGCSSNASLSEMLKLGLWQRLAGLTDVSEVVDSFVERSGISDQTQIDAVSQLVLSARVHNWWNKCDLIYPFAGGTAGAHAQNLKSSNFTITWNGTVTHDANGVTGNGVDGHGTTVYFPNSSGTIQLNSAHISAYVRTIVTGGRYLSGAHDAVANGLSFGALNLTIRRGGQMNDAAITTFSNPPTGNNLSALARIDSANKRRYAYWDSFTPGTSSELVTAVNSVGISTAALYVLARNNNGVADLFTDANLAFLTVGSGITFAEFLVMQADINVFQTALGRAV